MLDDFITKNPGIMKKARKCKNKEELTSLLKDHNLSVEDKVIEKLYDYLNKTELDENALDSVAGGGTFVDNLADCEEDEAMDIIKNGGRAYYIQPGQVYVNVSAVDWDIIKAIMNSRD